MDFGFARDRLPTEGRGVVHRWNLANSAGRLGALLERGEFYTPRQWTDAALRREFFPLLPAMGHGRRLVATTLSVLSGDRISVGGQRCRRGAERHDAREPLYHPGIVLSRQTKRWRTGGQGVRADARSVSAACALCVARPQGESDHARGGAGDRRLLVVLADGSSLLK